MKTEYEKRRAREIGRIAISSYRSAVDNNCIMQDVSRYVYEQVDRYFQDLSKLEEKLNEK